MSRKRKKVKKTYGDCRNKQIGCPRQAIYKEARLCNACMVSLHLWMKKRTVTQLMNRVDQLAFWSQRLDPVAKSRSKRKFHAVAGGRR